MNLKNPEKALEDASKCISVKPDWVKGYSRKGTALQSLGKYEDAEQGDSSPSCVFYAFPPVSGFPIIYLSTLLALRMLFSATCPSLQRRVED